VLYWQSNSATTKRKYTKKLSKTQTYYKSTLLKRNIHSFIHWTTWPAMGRCALHTTRSLAVSHATSAASPVSISSCCIHGWQGWPRGRFNCGLLSGARGGDQFLPWQPDAVPCGPEWLLEVVLRGQTSHDVVSWSCNEHFRGQSGLWWWRWWRSRTSEFRVYGLQVTSRSSIKLTIRLRSPDGGTRYSKIVGVTCRSFYCKLLNEHGTHSSRWLLNFRNVFFTFCFWFTSRHPRIWIAIVTSGAATLFISQQMQTASNLYNWTKVSWAQTLPATINFSSQGQRSKSNVAKDWLL